MSYTAAEVAQITGKTEYRGGCSGCKRTGYRSDVSPKHFTVFRQEMVFGSGTPNTLDAICIRVALLLGANVINDSPVIGFNPSSTTALRIEDQWGNIVTYSVVAPNSSDPTVLCFAPDPSTETPLTESSSNQGFWKLHLTADLDLVGGVTESNVTTQMIFPAAW